MPTKTTVTGNIQDLAGVVATSGYVEFKLQPASKGILYFVAGIGVLAAEPVRAAINGAGNISIDLWGNDLISPGNTYYDVIIAPGNEVLTTVRRVLITGGSYSLSNPTFAPVINLVPQYQTITTDPINNNLDPAADMAFNLGQPGLRWANGYFRSLYADVLLGPDTSGLQFLQAGVGAVSRTVQSKLRDIVSALDFGAVGDGSTNDKDAVQAAIDAVAGNRGLVIFPNTGSTYKLSSSLSNPSNVTLLLLGGARFSGSGSPTGAYVHAIGSGDVTITVGASDSIQAAVNEALIYTATGVNVTINLAAATYTTGFVVNGVMCARGNGVNGAVQGVITINGAGVGSTTLADTSAEPAAIIALNGAVVVIQNFKLTSTNGGALFPTTNALIALGGPMDFGNVNSNGAHFHCELGGTVIIGGTVNYTISNSNQIYAHIDCVLGGRVIYTEANRTVTLSGSPDFSTAFVNLEDGSLAYMGAAWLTFSGAAGANTRRYMVKSNSILRTNNGSATFIPGTLPGLMKEGGKYTPIPAPSLGSLSAGFGTGATMVLGGVSSNDQVGSIILTTGTTPSNTGTFVMTFGGGVVAPSNSVSAVFTVGSGSANWEPAATAQVQGFSGNTMTVYLNNDGANFPAGTLLVYYKIETH